MKTKITFLVLILSIFPRAHAACRNYDLLARQANLVSINLESLHFETEQAFPHSWNFLDQIQKAEMDAAFLFRVTRSGAMPCWQTKSNYSNLQQSTEILRRYFQQFSRRRDIRIIENDWRRFIDSFKRLESLMQNAREE